MDFYLNFTSEEAAKAVLYTTHAEVLDEAGNVVSAAYTTPNFINIDTLGVIYKDDSALDGWHVNVRTMPDEDSSALTAFEVTPAPAVWRRVWG